MKLGILFVCIPTIKLVYSKKFADQIYFNITAKPNLI